MPIRRRLVGTSPPLAGKDGANDPPALAAQMELGGVQADRLRFRDADDRIVGHALGGRRVNRVGTCRTAPMT